MTKIYLRASSREPTLFTPNPMHHLIIDARAAFKELERRLDGEDQPAWIRSEIPRLVEQVWYSLIQRSSSMSALTDYACRLRDQHHPFARAVLDFGLQLQDELDNLGFYDRSAALEHYHFPKRYGRTAIIVSYIP